MHGVRYIVGEDGQAEAVVIDLAKHGRLWEDFHDLLVARSRRKQPRERLDDVRARLRKAGKLDDTTNKEEATGTPQRPS